MWEGRRRSVLAWLARSANPVRRACRKEAVEVQKVELGKVEQVKGKGKTVRAPGWAPVKVPEQEAQV